MFHFAKIQRLQQKADYEHVFSNAKKTTTNELLILHCDNTFGYARIGFVVSKKMVAKATQRNRIKRIIRESFRTHKLPSVDMIILARKGVSLADNKVISSNLSVAWENLVKLYANR